MILLVILVLQNLMSSPRTFFYNHCIFIDNEIACLFPQEKQVSCTDNRMPIACDLGNPLQRDAEVSSVAQFLPHLHHYLHV